MDEKPRESKIASTLGKYRLIAELGTGGMANVYLAVMRGHGNFNKLVVLKIPRDEVTTDPTLLAMFIDEARLAARLMHPNVVQTYEVIREADRDIIVMEYLDGYTLNEVIVRGQKSGKPVSLGLHLRILSEALKGLHYAHEATDFDGSPLELVHRDVSPHNVFLTFDEQVKILDFGIAKAAMQSHQTEFGTFKGKVRYMPVEQLAGANMDRRTDVFAAGAMVWEAVVGERLWKKKSDVEVMSAIIAGDIPMPRDVKPEVPEALDAICRKAMAQQKEDRYASCADLQRDLDAYIATLEPRPRLRDMVSYLQESFGGPRAARRKVIEEQLKSASVAASGAFVALTSLAPATTKTPSASSSVPALPALNALTTTGTPHSVTAAVPISASEPAVAPRRSPLPLILLATVTFATLVGVALYVRRGAAPPSPADPVAAATKPAQVETPVVKTPDAPPVATLTSTETADAAKVADTPAKPVTATVAVPRWSPPARTVVAAPAKPAAASKPSAPEPAPPPPPSAPPPKPTRPDLGY